MRAWGARDLSSILSTPTMSWLYVLKNEKNKYYIGSTINLERRLKEHNYGNTRSTKRNRPWHVVFSQKFDCIILTKKAERKIKSYKSRVILEKIISDGIFYNS